MSEGGDLAEALKIIIEYMRNKGQLPRLDRFILFWIGLNALADVFHVDPNDIIDIDKLVREYSINSPSYESPLWLRALSEITKLNSKVEIITQLHKRKPLE